MVWVYQDDTEKDFGHRKIHRAKPDWWFVIYGPSSVVDAVSEHPSEQMADARRRGLEIPSQTTANGAAAGEIGRGGNGSDPRACGGADTTQRVRDGPPHGERREANVQAPRHVVSPALESWNGNNNCYHYSKEPRHDDMGAKQPTAEKQPRDHERAVSPQWDRTAGRGPVRVEYVTEYWTTSQEIAGIRFYDDGDEGVSIGWESDMDAPTATQETDSRTATKNTNRGDGGDLNLTDVASSFGGISMSNAITDTSVNRDYGREPAPTDVVSSLGGQDQRGCSQPYFDLQDDDDADWSSFGYRSITREPLVADQSNHTPLDSP